jgi:hypothetical protein
MKKGQWFGRSLYGSWRLPEAARWGGDGLQVSAGPSKSWDVNNGVVWLWEHLF